MDEDVQPRVFGFKSCAKSTNRIKGGNIKFHQIYIGIFGGFNYVSLYGGTNLHIAASHNYMIAF